jgi:hypothetical protein
MPTFDWKKVVQTVSPVLASALGGPLAGAAVSALGTAILGKPDASQDEIATAIASGALTGDQIVAMKAADVAFQTRMRELDIDLAKLDQEADAAVLADIQSARARQVETKDYMPQIIFGLLLLVYVSEVMMFFYGKMPEDEYTKALMTRAFGTVEGGLTGAVAYFLGSSRGSKKSGDAIREIATRKD